LNILFTLYHDFTANSAGQVHALANALTRIGCSCAVAVPGNKRSINVLGPANYRALEFAEFDAAEIFPDRRGPDIIHAWTPRENVRRFCAQVRERCDSRLFIQMEDNEWHIVSRILGCSFEYLDNLPLEEADSVIPQNWSHPKRARQFMAEADGVTLIIGKLGELVPDGVPTMEVWPSAPEDLFYPRPINRIGRAALGIPENSAVLVYTGNVHAANANEMRSLYLAVAVLNREGYAATLVRAGSDYHPFLGPDETWARQHSIELGRVAHNEIPALLSLADVFVQPGKADEFNEYRFPSKIPEFMSIGRPVVMPLSNIGRHVRHCEDAYVLEKADGLSIAGAVRTIMLDRNLYEKLARGSLRFFDEKLNWNTAARRLLEFYSEPRRTALQMSN
jgi:glycosyltransferase involved in cell wall biosynthesis